MSFLFLLSGMRFSGLVSSGEEVGVERGLTGVSIDQEVEGESNSSLSPSSEFERFHSSL